MTTADTLGNPAADSQPRAEKPPLVHPPAALERRRHVLARLRSVPLLVVVCIGVSLLLVSNPPLAVVLIWWAALIAAIIGCGVGAARQ